jgi:MFS family permease
MEQPEKLLNRNYFLLWQGQSISRLGSQAFSVAMLFWLKRATGSAALMGLLQMASSLSAVVLGPVGGAFADRHSRRRIIILSDLLRGLAVLSLAGLLFLSPDATGVAIVWLFVVSVLIATVSAFFGPAISAAIPDLVPEDRLTTANSLGQISQQLAVFLGQGLGGTLFRLLGAPVLFAVNGVSYLFAAVSESFVAIPQAIPQGESGWKSQVLEFKRDISDGLRYVWRRRGLRETVLVSAFITFFTAPIIILLPFYVEDVLRAEVDWYGYLLAMYGVGTLGGYLFAGSVRLPPGARRSLLIFILVFDSITSGALGLVRGVPMAMALAFVGGFTGGYVTVNITTIVQMTTPCEIRGRVFGLLATISGALAPIAMGLAGVVADLVDQNIPLIYISCGVIMTLLSMLVSLNGDFRSFLTYEGTAPEAPVGGLAPQSKKEEM